MSLNISAIQAESEYVPIVPTDDLVHALKLIQHATKPSPDDGGYHEAAYDIASEILLRIEAREIYDRKHTQECVIQLYSSRACEVGTKGCIVTHKGT